MKKNLLILFLITPFLLQSSFPSLRSSYLRAYLESTKCLRIYNKDKEQRIKDMLNCKEEEIIEIIQDLESMKQRNVEKSRIEDTEEVLKQCQDEYRQFTQNPDYREKFIKASDLSRGWFRLVKLTERISSLIS